MKEQIRAILAEFSKNRHSRIRWITFLAFALAPVFGGVFMLMMKDIGYEGLSGLIRSKAIMFSIETSWASFLGLLSQATGIGGILVFGFVASWLFGREYSDGTAKDLLALPVSRSAILNAKFIYYLIWCFALVISNLLLGLIIGVVLQLDGWSSEVLFNNLKVHFITTILIIMLNTPIAFFALFGKGYLTPLGIVALLLVLAQIIGAMGIGSYFPWTVPGLYTGSGGEEMKSQLSEMSFILIILTGVLGYVATIFWWKYSDQK